MTDDEFKRHLYRQLEEDKKNQGVLTHRLYPPKDQKSQKHNTSRFQKSKKI